MSDIVWVDELADAPAAANALLATALTNALPRKDQPMGTPSEASPIRTWDVSTEVVSTNDPYNTWSLITLTSRNPDHGINLGISGITQITVKGADHQEVAQRITECLRDFHADITRATTDAQHAVREARTTIAFLRGQVTGLQYRATNPPTPSPAAWQPPPTTDEPPQ